MRNIVERFTAELTPNDDGTVAIEYVVMAGLVATGVAVVFGAALWTDLRDTLVSIV